MEMNEYQAHAARTANRSGTLSIDLAQGALGLCGESGEAADLVKKFAYHGHELPTEKLIRELGDILWYVAEMASVLGVGLEFVASANIVKLSKRYPEGFSSERSVNREEK